MSTLSNARYEAFAVALANGETADAAYEAAGFKANRGNASRLKANDSIMKRVAEILSTREERMHRKFEVTKEQIVAELAKIGFADIRKAVKWGHRETGPSATNPDQMTFANDVALMPSSEIDNSTAGAIAEISETVNGIKIKLHDKRAALVDMGRHLGMFKEVHEHSGPDGGPIPIARIERVIVDPADTDRKGVPPAPG